MHTAIFLSGSANRHFCCCYCSRHLQPRKVACRPLLLRSAFIAGARVESARRVLGSPPAAQTPGPHRPRDHTDPGTTQTPGPHRPRDRTDPGTTQTPGPHRPRDRTDPGTKHRPRDRTDPGTAQIPGPHRPRDRTASGLHRPRPHRPCRTDPGHKTPAMQEIRRPN